MSPPASNLFKECRSECEGAACNNQDELDALLEMFQHGDITECYNCKYEKDYLGNAGGQKVCGDFDPLKINMKPCPPWATSGRCQGHPRSLRDDGLNRIALGRAMVVDTLLVQDIEQVFCHHIAALELVQRRATTHPPAAFRQGALLRDDVEAVDALVDGLAVVVAEGADQVGLGRAAFPAIKQQERVPLCDGEFVR